MICYAAVLIGHIMGVACPFVSVSGF